ncbi:Structural protein P5 [Vibrio crassostreae]|nr:Structural protein P5 [Vibrio crassostreae]
MASKTIIAAGVGIALGGLIYMAYKSTLPRGVRNNNPLNIRESKGDKTQWKGEALLNTDEAFEEFTNPAFGFRAGARILRSYQRQGIRNLTGIINRFAPSHENDTKAYISHVSRWAEVSPLDVLDLDNDELLARLLHAMSRMEVGNFYGLEMARKGVALA